MQTTTTLEVASPAMGAFYHTCPLCPIAFRLSEGLIWHMVTEHWWDPYSAAEYCDSQGTI